MSQQQQSLFIEPPKHQLQKLNTLLSTYQLTPSQDEPGHLKLQLLISDIYIRNLLAKKQQSKLNQQQRRIYGSNCLIVADFVLGEKRSDGRGNNLEEYRGEIVINNKPYQGLQVKIELGECQLSELDYVCAKLIYVENDAIKYKTFPLFADQVGATSHSRVFLIQDKYYDLYFHPRLAIQITITRQPERMKGYRGIRNEGNTCYMNTILQILFYLRPLRRTVLQYSGDNKVVATLRNIFMQLADNQNDSHYSPVDALDLITAYGRFAQVPLKQQDIHQFLLGFLDQLENQISQFKQLWLGSSRWLLRSIEQEKPYSSSVAQDFNCLDLQLEDNRGNPFSQVVDSLRMLLEQQRVDDLIQTDQWGRVRVSRQRQFSNLPNVVFLNLKRYMYRADKGRSYKILADLAYPQQISLGFLQQTPGDEVEYTLYAVAVHAGQTYNSGHYYTFINTSIDPAQPFWLKFNDSIVTLSSPQQALSYTGGKGSTLQFSKEFLRFVQRKHNSQQTAYLLVYLRTSLFRSYQEIECPLPREYFTRKRAKMISRDDKEYCDFTVMLLDSSLHFEPFGQAPDTINIRLRRQESVFQQFRQIGDMFGIKVGSLWKVNINSNKIKCVVNWQDLKNTPERIMGNKRGHNQTSYVLIVPQTVPVRGIGQRKSSKGLVHVKSGKSQKRGRKKKQMQGEEKDKDWDEVYVVYKSHLDEFIGEMNARMESEGEINSIVREKFEQNWVDYLQVQYNN